ncbi:MAG: type II toxin-antitoxin system HicA family toxin [Thermodesulfobacteriota bacterium]
MKSVSGKELCKILEKKGWNLLRIQGSHHIYGKEGKEEIIVVPVHGNKDLKKGLLRKIMRITEISEDEL